MPHEVYSSSGINSDLLLEPKKSDPPTVKEEDDNGASDLPIIIQVSDSSVSSDSGSSDTDEPISRKARKLAIRMATKTQTTQPKSNIRGYFDTISSAEHRNNVNAQMAPDIMNLWSVVPSGTSRDLGNISSEAENSTDASSSSCSSSSPVERRNGYILDNFVVASSDSDNDDDDNDGDAHTLIEVSLIRPWPIGARTVIVLSDDDANVDDDNDDVDDNDDS
jgi:hypothetical protein